jgi:hypothetical protein
MTARKQLVHFLEEELGVPEGVITFALRHCEQTPNYLAITLWQYGLVTLDQLAQIFDWLEGAGDWESGGVGEWGR